MFELNRLGRQPADAHLGSGQIGHDGEGASGRPGGRPQIEDVLLMGGELAVGEIQARDIHARLNHPFQHVGRARRGADGCDDPGLVSAAS